MRKKLLSYVLSMALVFGSVLPVLARDINEASTLGTNVSGVLSDSDKGVTNRPNAVTNDEADMIVSRITQVFGYKAGALIYTMDANRGFNVFDAGKFRASYAYNFENGSYSVSNFAIYGTDAALIAGMSGNTGAEKMESFLNALGYGYATTYKKEASGSTTEDLKYETHKVGWLQTAYDTIMSGVNYSVQIDFLAAGGASLTTMKDGKPEKVYSADGTQTSEYVYKNGFLDRIVNLVYEVDLEKLKEIQGYENLVEAGLIKDTDYTPAELDALKEAVGTQNTGEISWKPSEQIIFTNAYGQMSHMTDARGTILGVYEWSKNGSMLSYTDKTSGSVTQYNNGVPSVVLNSKGFVETKYHYAANNTMTGIDSFHNGVITQRTAFYFGQAVATVDMSHGQPMTFEGIVNAYLDMTKPGKTVAEIQSIANANHFKSFSVFTGQLGNTNLLIALGLSKDAEAQKLLKQLEDLTGLKEKDNEQSAAYTELVNQIEAWNKAGNDAKPVLDAEGKVTKTAAQVASEEKDAAFQALLNYLKGANLGGEIGQIIKNLGGMSAEQIANHMKNLVRYEELKKEKETAEKGGTKLSDEKQKEFDKLAGDSNITGGTAVAINISNLSRALGEVKNLTPANRTKQLSSVDLARDMMINSNNGHSAVMQVSITHGKTVDEKVTGSDTTSRSTSIRHNDRQVVSGSTRYDEASGKGVLEEATETTTTTTIEKTTKETMTFGLTIMNMGAAAFSMAGAECILYENKETRTETQTATTGNGKFYDPAVVGVVNSFVDADGNVIEDVNQYLADNPGAKVFAKVNAEAINMVDGGAFHAADGEEIFIEVDAEMAAALSVGDRAMFMGDVNRSADGKFEMTINRNYSLKVDGQTYNGMVVGDKVDSAMKEFEKEAGMALNGQSQYAWMNANVSTNRDLFGLGGNSYLNDWKAGWSVLAGWSE